jgi:hypothetical protein
MSVQVVSRAEAQGHRVLAIVPYFNVENLANICLIKTRITRSWSNIKTYSDEVRYRALNITPL